MSARKASSTREAPSRSSLRLLADPTVGPYFIGRLTSTAGVWMHNVAAAIVVFQLTGSATWVGAVSVAQFAPQFFLTPWSGARADRMDRRRQLMGGRLVAAVGSGGLALWALTVGLSGTAGAAAVVAAAFVVGVGFSLGGPAMQALLPSMVRPNELAAAVALNSVPFTVARTGGPALGALLVTTGGPAVAFIAAAAGQLIFMAILSRLRISESGRVRPKDSSIRAAVRYVRADPAVAAVLFGGAIVSVGADPVITLSPSIAEGLRQSSAFVGALASSFGLGAGVAFLVLGRLRQRFGSARLSSGGLVVLGAGTAFLAFTSTPTAALLSFGVAGAGMTFAITSLNTLLQERAPDELRGRVMALWSVAFLGTRPLAAAINGYVADTVSVHGALLLVTALVGLGAYLARPARVDPRRSQQRRSVERGPQATSARKPRTQQPGTS